MTSEYNNILSSVLDQVKKQDYSGWEKFDALNSRFLLFVSLKSAWLRFLYIQGVKEMPFNIRPLFGVKKTRNQKGMALFARANLFLFETSGNKVYLEEAEKLLVWLLENPSPGQKNFCWGYSFLWQDIPPFCQKIDEPNIVVTCFVGESLVHAYKLTQKKQYLDALISIADFITKDLPVMSETESERAVSYILTEVNYTVLNVQVMSASLLAKIEKLTGNSALAVIAKKQVNYLMGKQTDYGAWYYTWPHTKSYIRHDNYHTGGILDNLLEYIETTGNKDLFEKYKQGLEYYRQHLFEEDGAPRWMNDSKFPHDVHGAAQGIISFTKASKYFPEYLHWAESIADWTIKNMYREKRHDFIYRKGRFYKWNYSLIRWCNGWMCRALAEYYFTKKNNNL
jgi:hypothetical protein